MPRGKVGLFTVLLRKNKSFLKCIKDFAIYRKVFFKHNIDLESCDLMVGANALVISDKKNSLLYRCSLNKFGRTWVTNNYENLQLIGLDRSPQAKGLWKEEGLVLSAESFLPGRGLKVEELSSGYGEKIIAHLVPFYLRNKQDVIFDFNSWFGLYESSEADFSPPWRVYLQQLRCQIQAKSTIEKKKVAYTRIHGDLTFRNVLVDGETVNFIDLDRSEINFPEMDIFLFYLHRLTYQQDVVDYSVFFSNILSFVEGRIKFPEIEMFYSVCPAFKINQSFNNDIAALFLYRMTVLILYASDPKDPQVVALLKKICGDYERIKN